jgi:hypothetical protein
MAELVCLVGWLAIGSLETVEHSPFCYIWASSKTCRMILSVFNYQHKSLLHGSSVNNVLHAKPGLSDSLDCTGILCKHLCIFHSSGGSPFSPWGVQYAEIRAL